MSCLSTVDRAVGAEVTGGFVDLDGDRCYRIEGYDRLSPFFMTVTGATDFWLFLSSSGGLTAGRRNVESALFPYYPDDRIADSGQVSGGLTVIRGRDGSGAEVTWEPFASSGPFDPLVSRALVKSVLGDVVTFEETHHGLQLTFMASWRTSQRFGLVRRCVLRADAEARAIELLDGLVNLLPPGVTTKVQNELSNLLDAYKRTELDSTSGLGIASLSSALTDRAEPSEALGATVAWQVGLEPDGYLLSTGQVPAFRRGERLLAEVDVRGRRGAYLALAHVDVLPGHAVAWTVVADTGYDAAQVTDLAMSLRTTDPAAALADDAMLSRAALTRIIAAGDGLQGTADELACVHHSANVLFNAMRGGIPASAYEIRSADVSAFVTTHNLAVATKHGTALGQLPDRLTTSALVGWADETDDPDLRRLARGFLPLTFSRRHGDPTRPWNRFDIRLTTNNGEPLVDYAGNWRDIFQNWEALAWSFPELVESMVLTFVNATTVDGYNPYRLTHAGVDWEVPEPDNPWSNLGYWSDHQIVYLLRLLEVSARFHPQRLAAWLEVPWCTYADVPYRIADYAQLVADPVNTITFDDRSEAATTDRVARIGSDGRLLHDADGALVRATLGEKLLLLLAAKLVNLVPLGGIWMNTQRPEWNDANNALVGRGLSVVTVAHLRRYLAHIRLLLDGDVSVSEELFDLLSGIQTALDDHAEVLDTDDDVIRRAALDALGGAGAAYRARVYEGLSGARQVVPASSVHRLIDTAMTYVDRTITANRRTDGLYHAYNTLDLSDGRASVGRLAPMLEGQVAVLSSGLLDGAAALALLQALRRSPLYRPDQNSYQLYPDKDLAGFLVKNRFPAAVAEECPLIGRLADDGDRSIVVRDAAGAFHFAPGVRNAAELRGHLRALDERYADAVARDGDRLAEIYEGVFQHRDFTGRSGTFFAYEGLGSIYWHMVSKLLLAVQECTENAVASDGPADVVAGLRAAYEDVRSGLGYCKSPAEYGAFPTDPYSHTPAGQGARQPGMTGQVKEEILTRLGELGLRVDDGAIAFRPTLLRGTEWTLAGTLTFTFCEVPVVYRRVSAADPLSASVLLADGETVPCPGGRVPPHLSARVFARDGHVQTIRVDIPGPAEPAHEI